MPLSDFTIAQLGGAGGLGRSQDCTTCGADITRRRRAEPDPPTPHRDDLPLPRAPLFRTPLRTGGAWHWRLVDPELPWLVRGGGGAGPWSFRRLWPLRRRGPFGPMARRLYFPFTIVSPTIVLPTTVSTGVGGK